jgi:transcriptional regulator with XRE-family HTH domain
MSIQVQVDIRTRKLGVLIRAARLAARKTIPEISKSVGITSGIFRAWEEGRRAPSLPELEVLAYALNLPLDHFWSRDARSEAETPTETLNLPTLVALRQRVVGAQLRQLREKASISLQVLSERSGISTSRLKGYEKGEHPIPLPELEALMALMEGQVDNLFDQTGPIGRWMQSQKSIQSFLELPPELQAFVTKPINRPYLELAIKLSDMSTDKLRSVAENLLDITY